MLFCNHGVPVPRRSQDRGRADAPQSSTPLPPLTGCATQSQLLNLSGFPVKIEEELYAFHRVVTETVVQSLSCVRLCDPMDRSAPGFPVHHQLPELAPTHVHRVGDDIQPSIRAFTLICFFKKKN